MRCIPWHHSPIAVVRLTSTEPLAAVRWPVARCAANASDNPETATRFFFDELREANSALEALAEAVNNSAEPIHPRPTEEKATFLLSEGAEGLQLPEKDAELNNPKPGNSNRRVQKSLAKSDAGKLPIESNGPPMVMLQPYLASNGSQEQLKEKLPQLPYSEPHKLRPAGLPRPSLRRRLGLGFRLLQKANSRWPVG